MQIQNQQQQFWNIKFYAKTNKFCFKLKATNVEPNFKTFHRLSVFIKFHDFLLKVKSTAESPIPPKSNPTVKSKFLRFLKRFNIKRKAKKITDLRPHETKTRVEQLTLFDCNESKRSLVVLFMGLLSKLMSETVQSGKVVTCLVMLMFLASFVYKFGACRFQYLLVSVVAITVASANLYYMNKNLASHVLWKTWNYVVSSGCLYLIFQAIVSRFCQSLQVTSIK